MEWQPNSSRKCINCCSQPSNGTGLCLFILYVSIKTSFFNSRSMVVKERASSHGAIHSSISQLNLKPIFKRLCEFVQLLRNRFLKSTVVCSNNPKIGHLVPVLYRVYFESFYDSLIQANGESKI